MSNISVITQDIVDRVKSIPSFENRVGLALGGQEIDPTNKKLPRPSSWVIFVGDTIEELTTSNCVVSITYNYIVKVLIDYNDENQLIQTDLPLLYEVVDTLKGQIPISGNSYAYQGMFLEELSADRMVWNLSFNIKS